MLHREGGQGRGWGGDVYSILERCVQHAVVLAFITLEMANLQGPSTARVLVITATMSPLQRVLQSLLAASC